MNITIPVFKGMRPIAAAHLLEKGEAQVAENTDFDGGDLRALAAPLKVADVAGGSIDTLARWTENSTEHWLEFTVDVDVCKGPVADDSYERIYLTGLSEPRFFANDNVGTPFDQDADYIKLGIPAPTGALSASGYSTASTYRAYVYTHVNRYGEEGPPSPLLEISDYGSGNVTLTGFSSAPSGRAIEFIRVYRTNSSAAGISEFQLVFATDIKIYSASATYNNGDLVEYDGDLFKCVQNGTTGVTPIGSATEWDDWYDNIADGSLQPDTLISTDFDPPPSTLDGLCSLPNGVMAGFVGSTIYMSEPYYPHAWPQGTYTRDFRVTVPAPLVALKVLGTSLVAMTTGPTLIVSGAQPDQMTPVQMDGMYPCISKKSATVSPEGVYYASYAGMVIANANGLDLATADLMSTSDWAAFTPATIHGIFHEGKYIAGHNDAGAIIIDFAKRTMTTVGFAIFALYLGYTDGILYAAAYDEVDISNPPPTLPIAIFKWAGSDLETLYYTWRSGIILTPADCNFGAARVRIDEEYVAVVSGAIAESGAIEDYNAVIFAAGAIAGGLGGAGIGTYGVGGDQLRSSGNLSVGVTAAFRWICDGVIRHNKTVSNSQAFRLPGGFKGRRFEIQIDGYVPVRTVEVASGMEELYQG